MDCHVCPDDQKMSYLAGFTHGEADKVVLAAVALFLATRGELLEGLHGSGGAHGVDAGVVVALVVDLVVLVGSIYKTRLIFMSSGDTTSL